MSSIVLVCVLAVSADVLPQAPPVLAKFNMPAQAPPIDPRFDSCPDGCDCGCREGQPCTCTHKKAETFTETTAGPRHGFVDGDGWIWNASTNKWWKVVPAPVQAPIMYYSEPVQYVGAAPRFFGSGASFGGRACGRGG